MFGKLLKGLLPERRRTRPGAEPPSLDDLIRKASELTLKGERQAAIKAWQAVLEVDPTHVNALNDFAACLADVGDLARAHAVFELAYSLDDTSLAVAVNHAKVLVEQRRSEAAMPLLRRAKIADPDGAHVDTIYAAACFSRGRVATANHYARQAYLRSFDNLRMANSSLFHAAYADRDEVELAIEHRFWGETLRPMSETEGFDKIDVAPLADGAFDAAGRPARRLRIGYWSPDFRSHSVRYFIRPVLQNHDRERFEVFLYHDAPVRDEQTVLIAAAADHFHDVFEQADAALFELIRSHRLDILVELAGQSSYNRLPMLQERMAPLQMTGFGYPPTTGLLTIDAKVLDRHVVTPDADRYYTEAPLALPSSFWCFDPYEDIAPADQPPVHRKGHVTFGCAGNISKITDRMLAVWQQILVRVPTSRLVIRSISFQDPLARADMLERLEAADMAMARIDLLEPVRGTDFFHSFDDFDIVLDTYPFNGGTTSCFATYMGVPLISMAGQSLTSRMGLSILANLGAADLAVDSYEAYVERAVGLAGDTDALDTYKRTARARFRSSCLGNGDLFTREFEAACIEALRQRCDGTWHHESRVPALPAKELMRRAYVVLAAGQEAAATRIAEHCLRHHPHTGSAHLLLARGLSRRSGNAAAIAYLRDRLDHFDAADRTAALVECMGYELASDPPAGFAALLSEVGRIADVDPVDALQIQLYEAVWRTSGAPVDADTEAGPPREPQALAPRFLVVIPCDSEDRFRIMRGQLAAACGTEALRQVVVERCTERRRLTAYRAALARDDIDVVVFMQKQVEVHDPRCFERMGLALQGLDAVGFAGARTAEQLEWRSVDFEAKAGSFVGNPAPDGPMELRWLGPDRLPLVTGMTVLDGSLLAVRRTAAARATFDEELLGARTLLEEDWIRSLCRAGGSAGVLNGLGVFLDARVALDERDRDAALLHLAEKLNVEPFAITRSSSTALSAPVQDPAHALRASAAFSRSGGRRQDFHLAR